MSKRCRRGPTLSSQKNKNPNDSGAANAEVKRGIGFDLTCKTAHAFGVDATVRKRSERRSVLKYGFVACRVDVSGGPV
jgi:hypothetical protein